MSFFDRYKMILFSRYIMSLFIKMKTSQLSFSHTLYLYLQKNNGYKNIWDTAISVRDR